MKCIILSIGGGADVSLLETLGLVVEASYEVKEFFMLETYKAAKLAENKEIPLIGFDISKVDIREKEFQGFIEQAKESFSKNLANLYYYPKPHEHYQVDKAMLFMAFKNWKLEKFLIEILYRQGKLPQKIRNESHAYLKENLFAGRDKKIHLEGRPLSNLADSWELFKSLELSKQLIDNAIQFYPAPVHINLGTINRCNLSCNFCFFFASSYKKTHTTDFFKEYRELDSKIVHDVFDYAAKHGSMVDLVGPCEMLLDKRVPDFIRYAKDVGVRWVSMTTNGLLLDKEMAQRIIDSGLDSLSISIDAATEQTYKENRGGNFKKLVKNVEYFLEQLEKSGRDMFISLSMILNKEAENEVEMFKKKWSAYKVVNEFYIRNLICKENEGMDVAHKDNISISKRLVCQKMWDEIHVNPDGGIMPCCNMSTVVGWNNKGLGNLYEQTMEEIWAGVIARNLRRDLVNEDFSEWEICKNCKEWSYISVEKENGDIVSPSIEFVKVH